MIIDVKKNYVERLFVNGKQDESMKAGVGNVENILIPTTTGARDEVTKFETAEKFRRLIPPSPAPSGRGTGEMSARRQEIGREDMELMGTSQEDALQQGNISTSLLSSSGPGLLSSSLKVKGPELI